MLFSKFTYRRLLSPIHFFSLVLGITSLSKERSDGRSLVPTAVKHYNNKANLKAILFQIKVNGVGFLKNFIIKLYFKNI